MYSKLLVFAQNNKFLSKYINKESLPQFFRYLVVGFSSSFFELSLFHILYTLTTFSLIVSQYLIKFETISTIGFDEIKLKLYIANTISYTVIFIYNYLLQRTWAFKSVTKMRVQIFQYGALFIFNLLISNYLVDFFHLTLNLHSLISKVLSIAVVVSWNFVVYKKIIFKK